MRSTPLMETTPGRGASSEPFGFAVHFNAYDRYPHLWAVALAGLGATAALAVFGLPPVDVHPPIHRLGVMDPFCGMTRGVQAVARGEWGTAWAYNPASFAVVAAVGAAVVRWIVGVFTGRWLDAMTRSRAKVALLCVAALVVLEVNQQIHAARLMSG